MHLLRRDRRTQLVTLRQVQQQYDVGVPAVHHWEANHEILQKPKTKNEATVPVQADLSRDLPEWLVEFTENLEDEGV